MPAHISYPASHVTVLSAYFPLPWWFFKALPPPSENPHLPCRLPQFLVSCLYLSSLNISSSDNHLRQLQLGVLHLLELLGELPPSLLLQQCRSASDLLALLRWPISCPLLPYCLSVVCQTPIRGSVGLGTSILLWASPSFNSSVVISFLCLHLDTPLPWVNCSLPHIPWLFTGALLAWWHDPQI